MQHYIICQDTGKFFFLSHLQNANCQALLTSSALYKIFFNNGNPVQLFIDNQPQIFGTGEVLFCKPLNTVESFNAHSGLRVVAFNKEFYRFNGPKEEAAFYWFWFYSVKQPYTFKLNESELNFFEIMFNGMRQQFEHKGCVETEQEILKRILSTTIAKVQSTGHLPLLEDAQLAVIKKFNGLMEDHFKKKVSFSEIIKLLEENTSYMRQLWDRTMGKKTKRTSGGKFAKKNNWSVTPQIPSI